MFFLAFSENVSFNQEDAVMHKFIHFVMKSCVNFQFHYVSHLSTFCTVTYFLDHLRMVCQEVLMIFMGCKKISLFKNSVSTPKRKKISCKYFKPVALEFEMHINRLVSSTSTVQPSAKSIFFMHEVSKEGGCLRPKAGTSQAKGTPPLSENANIYLDVCESQHDYSCRV